MHDDSSEPALQLTLLGDPPRVYPAALRSRRGRRMVFETCASVEPGRAAETVVDGCKLLGEVVRCAPSGAGFEVWIHIEHSIDLSWRPHPSWREGEDPESLFDSLLTLHRILSEAMATPGEAIELIRSNQKTDR